MYNGLQYMKYFYKICLFSVVLDALQASDGGVCLLFGTMEKSHEEDWGTFWDWGDFLLPLPEVAFPSEHSRVYSDLWICCGAPDSLQIQHQGPQWIWIPSQWNLCILYRRGTAYRGSKSDSLNFLHKIES